MWLALVTDLRYAAVGLGRYHLPGHTDVDALVQASGIIVHFEADDTPERGLERLLTVIVVCYAGPPVRIGPGTVPVFDIPLSKRKFIMKPLPKLSVLNLILCSHDDCTGVSLANPLTCAGSYEISTAYRVAERQAGDAGDDLPTGRVRLRTRGGRLGPIPDFLSRA
jgi:hypothetical protein